MTQVKPMRQSTKVGHTQPAKVTTHARRTHFKIKQELTEIQLKSQNKHEVLAGCDAHIATCCVALCCLSKASSRSKDEFRSTSHYFSLSHMGTCEYDSYSFSS